MMLSPEAATIALANDDLKIRFVSWIGTEIQRISQKKNRLAVFNSLLLKASGASHSAVSHLEKIFWILFSISDSLFLSRGFVTQSTAYQRARSETADRRHALLSVSQHDANPRLHWIDNYVNPTLLVDVCRQRIIQEHALDSSWNEKYYPPSKICLGSRALLVGCLPSLISPICFIAHLLINSFLLPLVFKTPVW